MCLTCGCGEVEVETLGVEERLLAKNDDLAAHVRASLAALHVTAFNLMSSPGAGKTSLLERTVADLGDTRPVCVIEGDQETSFDADRIRPPALGPCRSTPGPAATSTPPWSTERSTT